MAQTSDRVSKLAAQYAKLNPDLLLSLTATADLREKTAREIKAIAASCLRQDETKGLRKRVRSLIGKVLP